MSKKLLRCDKMPSILRVQRAFAAHATRQTTFRLLDESLHLSYTTKT